MNKELVIVQKTKVSSFPPLMTAIELLARLGVSITLICGNEHKDNLSFLHKHCKKVIILNIPDANNSLEKIIVWSRIRLSFWKVIHKENLYDKTFYFPTVDTILAMGHRVFNLKYILNLYELYDNVPLYLRNLKKYVLNAQLITCPDYTRAHIFKVWWNLKETPLVIPNRPLSRPIFDEELTDNVKEIFKKIKDKKIIHYQGLITPSRALEPICCAVKDLSDFVLILMGKKTPYLEKLLSISDKIIYIPFLVPPKHLTVTSKARIGVLSYDHSCLNNIFCAPNKIWEYSSLGIPMLGNDIPGLRNVIENYRLGKCVDYNSIDQIKEAIIQIDNNYDRYRSNSYEYFDTVSLDDIFNVFLKSIK